MAATAASIELGLKDQGWPRWVVSLADGIAADVPGHLRTTLRRGDTQRSLSLFCQAGQLQPQFAASADCAVVFEGVLYNAAELAERLGIGGRFVDSASILLEAYQRWGEEFLGKLRGIFALLVWDGERDTFLCARDALGNHPLFFAKGGRELVVSTSLDAVVHHPSVSLKLNRPAIANYFLDSWPKLGETYYADAERVPPGCVLQVRRGKQTVQRYWDPHSRQELTGRVTEDEIGQFDELLTRAVERFFHFGPLGIYLSGGLDSVSIAAVAADLSLKRGAPLPHALSLIFPSREANEESVQKAVGSGLGLPQDLVPFEAACGAEGMLVSGLELSRRMPQPLQNYYLSVYNHLAELGMRSGCRAILTGTGGDEWLSVSPFLAADLIRAFDFRGLYRLWDEMRRSHRQGPYRHIGLRLLWNFGIRTLLRDSAVRALQKGSPSSLNAVRRRHLRKAMQPWQTMDPELWREVYRRAEAIETDRTRDPVEYGAYVSESRRALDHPLVSWEMEETFENGKLLGIRFLHPYMDGELVEMLWRTPPALLNRGRMTKGLVRETVAKRFPGLGFEQQKKIHLTKFFPSVMRTEGLHAWSELGGAKALAEIGLADPQRTDSWVRTAISSGDHPSAFRVWSLMAMESWLQSRL